MSEATEFDVVLRGGRVVGPDTGVDGVKDIGIRGGKIAAVADHVIAGPGTEVIDVAGKLVIPGMIDTPLLEHRVARQKGRADLATLRAEAASRVPLGRRGDAWDVAHAALFLASDDAKYITGTEILVDGGLMARSA